jgi:uncharacterized protein
MPLLINLRHLEEKELELVGQLPAAELDIDTRDEMIRLEKPLRHNLEAQLLGPDLLLRGELQLILNCTCVRCLQDFDYPIELADWSCLIPLSGEEAVPIEGDTVDLTPFLREDILLELPQHPLCKTDCGGLKQTTVGKANKTSPSGDKTSSTWAELDKVKFRKE